MVKSEHRYLSREELDLAVRDARKSRHCSRKRAWVTWSQAGWWERAQDCHPESTWGREGRVPMVHPHPAGPEWGYGWGVGTRERPCHWVTRLTTPGEAWP